MSLFIRPLPPGFDLMAPNSSFFFCCQDQLQKLRLGLGTHGQVLVVLIVYKRDQIYVAYSHHPICDFLVSTTSIIFIVARAFHLTNSHTNTKALWWRFVWSTYELVGMGGTQELDMAREEFSSAGRVGAGCRGWVLGHIALRWAKHGLRRAHMILGWTRSSQQVHAQLRVVHGDQEPFWEVRQVQPALQRP